MISSGSDRTSAQERTYLDLRVIAEIVIGVIGAALVACAVIANQQWLDRHFLPGFFVSRQLYVFVESFVRVLVVSIGAVLALAARAPMARFIADNPARSFFSAIAIVLAFGASELMLRQLHLRAAEEQPTTQEPRRRLDARLGWVIVPGRAGHQVRGGRDVVYVFDEAGYRVRRVDEPVNPERPTILFTGESMIVGEGLEWEETIPAQTGALLGIQSANLAVSGYANDQAYLRLRAELPRFRRPVAVVSLFTPALFDRNLDDDRPHLGPALAWQPAEERWRLVAIARLLIRYRSTETIERGIALTREVLQATVDLARSREAEPLIIVPRLAAEERRERVLRQRILDDAGLPYISIELGAGSRIPGDGHPNPRGAHAIAVAIAKRLKELRAFPDRKPPDVQ
ncbi:MAG: hypothetical protein C5B57_02795 [Blastocatellia bacterium]|nr:MAG: hypothetical protein C5B57_02795 [Blastocatellia bacterium]